MTLVPGAIVLGFGAAAWWILYEHMLDAVDARMRLPAHAFAQRVSPRMDSEEFQYLTASFVGGDRSKMDRLEWIVVMRNDSAEIISESQPGLASTISLEDFLPLPDDFVRRPTFLEDKREARRPPPRRPGERPPPRLGLDPTPQTHLHREPIHFTSVHENNRWRVGAYSSLFATIFIGVDLAPFDADVLRTRSLFLWAALGGFSLSALAGWWIANKAMRPIRRITETAEHITAHALHERIQTTGREDQEFARLVNVLNAMMERLERSFHHAVRFSADASHELKTPLAVIRGELERGLKECEAGSPGEQTFLDLNEEVHRLNKITDALLMMSRVDAGSLSLDQKAFSLNDALVSFSEDAEILCAEEDLSYQCEILLALELTQANGGSLRLLDSQPDGKTRFAICLPLVTYTESEEPPMTTA
ncbi:MAG: histidine kinase dimerization/phospho-acceptor domain-containing protein [Verrucomicrobiales bacterium]